MLLKSSLTLMTLTALFLLYSILIDGSYIFIGIVGFFFLLQVKREWAYLDYNIKRSIEVRWKEQLYTLLFLTIGTYITFFLNHFIGLGGVLASSVVGLLGVYLFKQYATAIYCGSFIGMCCSIIFSNPFSLLVASFISGVLFILSTHFFVGYGGKLGFIAFCGTLVTSYLIQTPLRTLDPIASNLYFLIFIFVVSAGMATYLLQKRYNMDAVQASALVGMLFALLSPDPNHVSVVAAFCASFAGMVFLNKVKTYSEMFFITILTGALFILLFSLFDGSGGKLGATAFLATVSGISLIKYFKGFRRSLVERKKRLNY